MDCLSAECTITSNDRMVSCWLCLGSCHLKCSGLKARDADALADPGKCLHWTCSQCKKINIDFYKFFKSFKGEFEQLNNDFSSIKSKLAKFGELFENFPNLDKFSNADVSSSPKRKKAANVLLTTPSMSNSTVPTALNEVAVSDNVSAPSTSLHALPSPNLNSLPMVTDINSLNTVLPPTTNITNSAAVDNQTLRRPLKAIPPKKTVFVSRLAGDTSSEDVDFYIKSKLCNADVVVHKFKFSNPRSISSFKISISVNHFQNIMDQSFWPENTLVREYTYNENTRANRIGVLPQRASNAPKN